MNKIKSYSLALTLSLLLGGCGATTLNIQTNPSGANVKLLKSGTATYSDSVVKLPEKLFDEKFKPVLYYDNLENSTNLSKDDIKKLNRNLDNEFYSNTELLYVNKEGFRSKFKGVNIKEGEEKPITISLEKIDTELIIESEPSGAEVSFNIKSENLPIGWKQTFKTPVKFSATSKEAKELIKNGFKISSIRYDGYYPILNWDKDNVIEAGKSKTINIPLKPIITTIRVMSEPEGASVEDITDGGFGYLGETPIVRNFNWKDVSIWADRKDIKRSKNGEFEAIEVNLRITKPGYEDVVMQGLKVPLGEERVFKRGLKSLVSKINFSSDPEGAHVYVKRTVAKDIFNEQTRKVEMKTIEHKKHLGSTPFTYNIDPTKPLKHGDTLIFEKSGYKTSTINFAVGENSYHLVLEPQVIKAR